MSVAKLYSKFYFFGEETPLSEEFLHEAREYYAQGTKLYGVFSTEEQLQALGKVLRECLKDKGLCAHSPHGLLERNDWEEEPEISLENGYDFLFHGSFHLVKTQFPSPISSFSLENGKLDKYSYQMEEIQQHTSFDLTQYLLEHGALSEHMFLEGGAGSGKTQSLLCRLSYLWHCSEKSPQDFCETVEILFFSRELQCYFQKMWKQMWRSAWLLTGDEDYALLLAQAVPCHSPREWALDILQESLLCQKITMTEDVSLLKSLISKATEVFFLEKPEHIAVLQELALPLAQVEEMLFQLIFRLQEENLEVSSLIPQVFAMVDPQDPFVVVKNFLHRCVGELSKVWENCMLAQGLLHQVQVFPCFLSKRKVSPGQAPEDSPILMIDDVDMAQESLLQGIVAWANQQNCRLFLTRNRQKQLFHEEKGDLFQSFSQAYGDNFWKFYSLNKNYRTDQQILALIQEHFRQHEHLRFPVERQYSLQNYNHYLSGYSRKFFKSLEVSSRKQCFAEVYQELLRVKRRASYEKSQGMEGVSQSVGVIVETAQDAEALRDYLFAYHLPVNTSLALSEGLGQTPAFSDLRLLIRGLLFCDETIPLYSLGTSRFFALDIPKNCLYRLRNPEVPGEETSLLEYLNRCIQGQFLHILGVSSGMSWEDFQEKMWEDEILPYVQDFFDLCKPWEKYSPVVALQEEYRRGLGEIFQWLREGQRNNLWEIYDVLKEAQDLVSQEEHFSEAYLQETEVFCLSTQESLGLEFSHVIYLLGNEREGLSPVQVHYGSELRVGYCFPVKQNFCFNGYYSQENITFQEEKTRNFYDAFHRGKCSFTWIVQR